MAREGTRSATGNSKPRIFQTIDTTPAVKRTAKPKKTTTPASATTGTAGTTPTTNTTTTSTKEPLAAKVKGAKPTGVSKPAKKEGVGAKVC